ncbi:hypothetical protein BTN50_0819 [Candidatus Enterovibrio altilux]|uniref:Uncharacterized protein n=1 Tax=Candidatus Enterovibrio altilux TaxID=1927128 RepID=A0A291B8K1_9GAMM|nr:hypothetical protein BTN50_0819 [Candidatus Enterovibrio luxaltus]
MPRLIYSDTVMELITADKDLSDVVIQLAQQAIAGKFD